MTEEVPLAGGGSTAVHRRGDVVLRTARPWSATVLGLLRHLEGEGFEGAPRVVGDGWSDDGREALSYVPGSCPEEPWSDDAMHALGVMLRDLHSASSSYSPPDPVWLPWWGRDLGGDDPVLGHCDVAPWNVLGRNGFPVALVDWDTAGPVDARWEVAQAAWLNAYLHDDDTLPSPTARARSVAALCDGYGLAPRLRIGLVDAMVEVAVRSSAQEAIDAGVTRSGYAAATAVGTLGGGVPLTGHDLVWAMTWRTRAARWMLRHRAVLEAALS